MSDSFIEGKGMTLQMLLFLKDIFNDSLFQFCERLTQLNSLLWKYLTKLALASW